MISRYFSLSPGCVYQELLPAFSAARQAHLPYFSAAACSLGHRTKQVFHHSSRAAVASAGLCRDLLLGLVANFERLSTGRARLESRLLVFSARCYEVESHFKKHAITYDFTYLNYELL